jgi:hypothetical protein
VPNTTILSAKYNTFIHDVETDLNTPRPVVAGGTGATSADAALQNLSAEKYKQVVTNWDSTTWLAGSFYAATSATGAAPVAGHAFAGIAYYANATDLVLEALDITAVPNIKYIRTMTAGVWNAWAVNTFVRYDSAQGLTVNQQAQARSNIGLTKKNYIINGAMMVSQENGVTAGGTFGYFPVDMFQYTGVGTAAVVSASQAVLATPGGSPNRFSVSVSAADAVQDAGDFAAIQTAIEANRLADLIVGGGGKPLVLQFGIRAPAGTYCVAFRNGATNRSYVAEYTIAAGEANTDVIKSVTLSTDASGTWAFDNTPGMFISWALICGSTFRTTAGAWTAGNFMGSANQFNFMATNGNLLHLFDVGLYAGNVAPPFVVPDYVNELTACQRYFWKGYVSVGGFGPTATPNIGSCISFPSTMRSSPTMSTFGGTMTNTAGVTVDNGQAASFRIYASPTNGALNWYADAVLVAGSARL